MGSAESVAEITVSVRVISTETGQIFLAENGNGWLVEVSDLTPARYPSWGSTIPMLVSAGSINIAATSP